MAGRNPMAVTVFGERPSIFTDYTLDAASVEKGVERLFPVTGSGSYLIQAVDDVAKGLAKRDFERAVIVAITAGGPEFTDRYYDDFIPRLRDSGATFYAMVIAPTPPNLADYGQRNRELFVDAATRATGGNRVVLLSSLALAGRARPPRRRAHQPVPDHLRAAGVVDSTRADRGQRQAAGTDRSGHAHQAREAMTAAGRALAAAVALAATAAAQQLPSFRAGVDLVSLSVTVTDASGRYVTDLTPDQLSVFEDGAKQDITYSIGRTCRSHCRSCSTRARAWRTRWRPPGRRRSASPVASGRRTSDS